MAERQAGTVPGPGAGAAAPGRTALVLPFKSIAPHFAGPPMRLGEGSAVLGRATIGAGASLGAFCVIRADGHYVRIGRDVHLGDRATVHIDHDVYPAIIGDRVTVGANAVVHACIVGDDCVIGDDAVVLDGSVVENGVVVEAGSIVFPRSKLPGGHVYAGMPAKPVRAISAAEIAELSARMRRGAPPAPAVGLPAALGRGEGAVDRSVFVAGTARLSGRIHAAANASIWYGCDLDADGGEIVIGHNTNIQDNTIIHCSPGESFVIGADSTIGHNVRLADCRIGERSLIGIGSVVASGTMMEDDVFLAAGAETTEGQVLESGWLWGRRPAQKMVRLDNVRRALIAVTVTTYCGYARAFAQAERESDAGLDPT